MNTARKAPIILIADDDVEDRELTREAFFQARPDGDFRFVGDGEELVEYLFCRGRYSDPATAPRPDLVLLDLNMPLKNGQTALQEIKADASLRPLRIIILTTSRAEKDVRDMYDLSAASFVTKPGKYEELIKMAGAIAHYWLDIVELPPAPGRIHAT